MSGVRAVSGTEWPCFFLSTFTTPSLGIKLHIVLPRCWPRSQHLSEIEILLPEALEPYPYLLWKASGSFVQYLQSEPIWAWASIGTLTDAPPVWIHVDRAWMSGLPVPGSKSDTTIIGTLRYGGPQRDTSTPSSLSGAAPLA